MDLSEPGSCSCKVIPFKFLQFSTFLSLDPVFRGAPGSYGELWRATGATESYGELRRATYQMDPAFLSLDPAFQRPNPTFQLTASCGIRVDPAFLSLDPAFRRPDPTLTQLDPLAKKQSFLLVRQFWGSIVAPTPSPGRQKIEKIVEKRTQNTTDVKYIQKI